MMKRIHILYLLIPVILSSCTERIDIDLDETYTRLVVYGVLTTDTTTHYVTLSKTTSYFYNELPPPVSGAEIIISDDQGNEFTLQETEPGKYATSPLFAAVQGRTYTLNISLEEEINNFRNYTASTKVTSINPIDSIGLVHQPLWGEKGFYEVTCYYQEPPTRDFYMFNILINGKLVTDTINSRIVINDDFFNGNYTNGIGVGYLDQSKTDEILRPGDEVTFQGCNITEEFYDFVMTLQSETGFQTPLFSGPPANIKSNLSNGAVGFFTAYSVAYSSKVFQLQ
ncbi:MAG TPA: DUF4249 domain-containing protein [Bacteroidales bacterium]|nr:DUF4249 domain-containing protein [Bacteroidales bacterium]